jgi:phage repressor protein C with HTH and peptisase S24 domain
MTDSNTEVYGIRLNVNDYAPRFKRGDVLIIDPHVEAEAGDDVIINHTDGGFSIGTFDHIDAGSLHLNSVNDDSPLDCIATELIKSMACITDHGHRSFATAVMSV